MAEEKVLDMAGVAEDAAQAERVAEEAKQEPETGSYTHTFKKPFQWNAYFALVTAPPQKTSTGIESWHLFTADETAKVLEGVISGGAFMHAGPKVINGKLEPGYLDENGVDKNFLGKLAKNGFFPDNPQDAHGCYSSTSYTFFFDLTGQLCLSV